MFIAIYQGKCSGLLYNRLEGVGKESFGFHYWLEKEMRVVQKSAREENFDLLLLAGIEKGIGWQPKENDDGQVFLGMSEEE